MAVAALVSDGARVLLVRRAVVPRAGFWALPAGYMDQDELPEDAAVREIAEETGIDIHLEGLQTVVALGGWEERRGILLVYGARPVSGRATPADDVSDARWFAPIEVPWDELAFEFDRRPAAAVDKRSREPLSHFSLFPLPRRR